MNRQQQEQQDAIDRLRTALRPDDRLYTILRHVSRSGMSRAISVVHVRDGEPLDISWLVARALGDRIDRDRGGVVRYGAGMDMGFDLVYSLSRKLGYTDVNTFDHRWL